ncbi:MAG TPA: TonB-dependent receptor [Marinilabiliaceae bacterium]|nr:TonB-dependent receptor [Marinilabiliaceae bacterium]
MRIIFTLLVALFANISAFGQSQVSGHVYELNNKKKEAIIGANIHWLGTTSGTVTDIQGQFKLPTHPESSKIVVSFVGYTSDTISVNATNQTFDILLAQNQELDEVTVATRKSGTHISRINPITSIEITGEELCKAACCSLAESFETNASVDVSYTDAATGAKQIQLLGLAGTYVQMITENMPNNRGLASTFGLDFVPGPWMEAIQVSKGAASVTNGYESLTGQINVQYKKPSTSEKLFVNGFASNSGRLESNVNGSIYVSDKWKTAILAHASTDAVKNDRNKDGFLDEPLTQRYIFMNRWEYKPNDNVITQFGVKILDEERIGGQTDFDKTMDVMSQPHYGIMINTQNIESFLKVGYILPSDNNKSIALMANHTWYDQKSIYGRRLYDANQNYFMANLIWLSHFGNAEKHKYTAGLNFMYDDLSENLYGSITNISGFNAGRKEIAPGAYFQYTFALPDKFTLLTGIRADHHNLYGTFITPRLHARYSPNDHWVFRGSVGKGYRTPNALAEYNPILASSRSLNIASDITQEEGWNYGANVTNYLHIGLRELTINLEYYRTHFVNQMIMDLDKDAHEVYFYNLDGKSYSNVLQAEASMEIFRGMDVVAAWRWNDVKTTTGNDEKLQKKPLRSDYKGMLNLSYATPLKKWQFDYTAQLNGLGRIPFTNDLRSESFDAFQVHNAQITKFFRTWNVYVGIENLTDFTQANPIIEPESPFGNNFDSSLIWGPVMGRKIYFGFRFSISRDS